MVNKKLLGILLVGLVFGRAMVQADVTVSVTNNTKFVVTWRDFVHKNGMQISLPAANQKIAPGETKQNTTNIANAASIDGITILVNFGGVDKYGYPNEELYEFKVTLPSQDGSSAGYIVSGTNKDDIKLEVNTKVQAAPAPGGRAIPQNATTTTIRIMNGLMGESIREVYVKATGSTSTSGWGNNLLSGGHYINPNSSQGNLNLSQFAQNNANRFDIQVVTDKGKAYTLSNVAISQDGEVAIRK